MTVPSQESQAPAPENKVSDKEYNFAQVRKQLEQERQLRLQAEERAAQAEKEAQFRARSHDDDDDNEPYVDHKKLDKKLARFEENIEKKIDKKAEEKAIAVIEQERKAGYLRENPDFNHVMSPETIQKFADKYPKVAEKILRMPEGFERQQLVYENIKAMGLDRPEQKTPSIQEKIDQNRRSPYYHPSGQGSPGYASSGDFSQSGQKNAYEKMQQLKAQLRL